MLLHWPMEMCCPPYDTSGKGLPVAMSARPLVQAIRSAGSLTLGGGIGEWKDNRALHMACHPTHDCFSECPRFCGSTNQDGGMYGRYDIFQVGGLPLSLCATTVPHLCIGTLGIVERAPPSRQPVHAGLPARSPTVPVLRLVLRRSWPRQSVRRCRWRPSRHQEYDSLSSQFDLVTASALRDRRASPHPFPGCRH